MSILDTLNFDEDTGIVPGRLVMTIRGAPSSGKTHFALTAPGPIAIFLLDAGGTEGVANKFSCKEIFTKTYLLPKLPVALSTADFEKKEGLEALKIWNNLYSDFCGILESGEVRTVIVDTVSDVYDLIRMSFFLPKLGKMKQIMPTEYGVVYQRLAQLYKVAQEQTYSNAIFIAKEKPLWVNNKRTEKTEIMAPSSVVEFGSAAVL